MRGAFECKYCHALRRTESNYRIDAERSVLDIQYYCGTILKIVFPEGEPSWYKNCQGISSLKVDGTDKGKGY